MAISSSPIISYLREEANPRLTSTSLQEVVECNKVSPEPPFLHTKQSQFPQPLLITPVLQKPQQFGCPSLDMFQGLNVLLVTRVQN